MKKKMNWLTSVMVSAVLLVPSTSLAGSDYKVKVNGEAINFSSPLLNENGRLLIPINEAFDKLGASVNYDKKSNNIVIDEKYTSVELTVGSKTAYIHKKYDFSGIPMKVELDVAPKTENSTVYVPLRFAAESLGAQVGWDESLHTALIDKKVSTDPAQSSVQYKIVKPEEIKDNSELQKWYENNYTIQGVHFYNAGDVTYAVASAGYRPSGGYQTILNEVTQVSPGIIRISMSVLKPSPDMMVTDAITYPSILIKIEAKDIKDITGTVDVYSNDMSEKDLPYKVISTDDIKDNSKLTNWVMENSKTYGIHYMRNDETSVYALISAGEKNTGGYSVSIGNVVSKKPDEAYVYASVNTPGPDVMVTQAITYPYALVRIDDVNIKHVDGHIKEDILNCYTTIDQIGAGILHENVKTAELFSLTGEKLKIFDKQEIEKICESYNNAVIDYNPYIEMIAGNSISIILDNESKITFTSYGSKTNIIASFSSLYKKPPYHLVCPEIAALLLSENGDIKETDTISSVGAAVSAENVKSAALFNLGDEKLKDLNKDEIKKIIESYNNSVISYDPYIKMIAGNALVITFNDGSILRFTSYGSKTNVIAAVTTDGSYKSYHLVCPEIASILLNQ